eukprot:212106-Rhodomonas_salina.1
MHSRYKLYGDLVFCGTIGTEIVDSPDALIRGEATAANGSHVTSELRNAPALSEGVRAEGRMGGEGKGEGGREEGGR